MRRTIGIVLAVLGALMFAGSFVWRSVAIPNLVKLPTDTDETLEFEGKVVLSLDPTTYAPLDPPKEYDLTAQRRVVAIGDESTDDDVVMQEQLTLSAPPLFDGEQLVYQYLMDRSEAENLTGDKSWAFTESNVVDRGELYRLAFPFDIEDGEEFAVYNNQTDASYTARPIGTTEAGGLDVITFEASLDPTPVTPAYVEALKPIAALPPELTLDQLKPALKLYFGLDIDALLPQLAAILSPEDVQALLGIAGQPIKFNYFFSFSGLEDVEPSTGTAVAVRDVVEEVSAKIDPAALPPLQTILEKYAENPTVAAALKSLAEASQASIPVVRNEYTQTEASIDDLAGTVSDAKDQKKLAEETVPNILLWGGAALVVIGLVLALWPKRKPDVDLPPPAV